ncbi:MAG: adenine deaminase C-terminal domain-containing protein, partial [Halobacteria archaeon]|nr:adenine deaminase C-terminal domain-containing protein [Halobacteria archaeon]
SGIEFDVYATVPPQPLFDAFEPRRADDDEAERLVDLLSHPRVVGVGETSWIRLVGRETPAEILYEAAKEERKRVTGHGAGCSDENYEAFASVIDDDHEAISGDGLLERVENGVHAVGRYGSIRDDIRAVGDAYDEVGFSPEISLSTDGMWPRELVEEGYMDVVVRKAIEEGVDPIDAVSMATYVPARYYGLEDVGSLTPGKTANIAVLNSLEEVEVSTVLYEGEVVYDSESGKAPSPEDGDEDRDEDWEGHDYPDRFYDYIDVTTDVDDLRVDSDVAVDGEVRGIEYSGGLLSGETAVEPREEDGELLSDPENDVLKISLLDRHPDSDGTGFTGFVTGFGIEKGAVATTLTWETPGVLAVGADDDETVRAVERINEINGGWAVVRDGDVIAELPAKLGGVCSDMRVEETARLYGEVDDAIESLGSDVDRPMLGLQTLAFFGVPSLKMSFSGYADVLSREVVGLDLDE